MREIPSGDTKELKDILEWAERISSQIKRLNKEAPLNELLEEFNNHARYTDYINSLNSDLSRKMPDNDEDGNNSNTGNYELSESQKEVLRNSLEKLRNVLDYTEKKIMNFFTQYGAEELGKLLFHKRSVYCDQMDLDDFFNIETLKYGGSKLYTDLSYIPKSLDAFYDNLLSCSKAVKDMPQMFEEMQNTKDLKQVCLSIRKSLLGSSEIPDDITGIDFRYRDFFGFGSEFWSSVPDAYKVPDQFQKLRRRFTQILNEEDETEFIKQCADFHFDFLKLHPYNDGNGRTSRILLNLMLASHNFLIPSLYDSFDQKYNFYDRSDEAVDGDYKKIEYDLFQRIGHFYPIIIPKEYKDVDDDIRFDFE